MLAPGWHHAVKAPGVKELNEAHTKKFGRPADPIVGPAYACVQILAGALDAPAAPIGRRSATPSPPLT